MAQFSRRVFFQVGGLSLLGLAFKFPEPAADPFYTLGRVTTPYLRVFTSRSETAKQVGWVGLDDVIRIYDSARDPAGRLWHLPARITTRRPAALRPLWIESQRRSAPR